MNNNYRRRIMNNLKKLGVTALAGSLVAVSAQAGEMSVSGSANVTYKTKAGKVKTYFRKVVKSPKSGAELVVYKEKK